RIARFSGRLPADVAQRGLGPATRSTASTPPSSASPPRRLARAARHRRSAAQPVPRTARHTNASNTTCPPAAFAWYAPRRRWASLRRRNPNRVEGENVDLSAETGRAQSPVFQAFPRTQGLACIKTPGDRDIGRELL